MTWRILDTIKALLSSTEPDPAAASEKRKGGRKRKYHADREASVAERVRACRERKRCNETRNVSGFVTSNIGDSLSSSFLKRENLDDDGGDARARDADQIACEIELIIKADGHWPRSGWPRAVLVEQVTKRIRIGQKSALILDAVRGASARAPVGPIHSFNYFDNAIAQAHSQASVEPAELPADHTKHLRKIRGTFDGNHSSFKSAADELVRATKAFGEGG
jgi:hypothetical protein